MGKKVLVIDDQPSLLGVVEDVFDVIGLDFLGAKDGKTGINLAQEHRPDLIVCDYYMPGLHGLQVFEHIRSSNQTANIPFILMTMDESLEIRALEAGVDGFISKGTTDLITTILGILKV